MPNDKVKSYFLPIKESLEIVNLRELLKNKRMDNLLREYNSLSNKNIDTFNNRFIHIDTNEYYKIIINFSFFFFFFLYIL
jgi:CRISPR/Cas system CMR-associated protein Cmr1 (group 7 of RAMP superfamily)